VKIKITLKMDIFNKKNPLPSLAKRGEAKWNPPLTKRRQWVLSDIYPCKKRNHCFLLNLGNSLFLLVRSGVVNYVK
jgi:hypothetical protein